MLKSNCKRKSIRKASKSSIPKSFRCRIPLYHKYATFWSNRKFWNYSHTIILVKLKHLFTAWFLLSVSSSQQLRVKFIWENIFLGVKVEIKNLRQNKKSFVAVGLLSNIIDMFWSRFLCILTFPVAKNHEAPNKYLCVCAYWCAWVSVERKKQTDVELKRAEN